jgi:hypothetical protein
MAAKAEIGIGDLCLVMTGPPIGLWFSREERSMWNHGIIIDKIPRDRTYIVHTCGIIIEVSKQCVKSLMENDR